MPFDFNLRDLCDLWDAWLEAETALGPEFQTFGDAMEDLRQKLAENAGPATAICPSCGRPLPR